VPLNVVDVIDLFMSPQLDLAKLCPRQIKGHSLVKGDEKSQLGAIERLDYHDGSFLEAENLTSDAKSRVQSYKITNTDRPCFRGIGEITDTFTHLPVSYSGCLFKQAALDTQGIQNPMTLVEWKTELSDLVD